MFKEPVDVMAGQRARRIRAGTDVVQEILDPTDPRAGKLPREDSEVARREDPTDPRCGEPLS